MEGKMLGCNEEHESIVVDAQPMEGEVQTNEKRIEVPTTIELEKLIAAQDYRCALSGQPLEPRRAALDHKHPVSRGGNHCIDNLQWIDPVVNKAKHTLTNQEFIELCNKVCQYAR